MLDTSLPYFDVVMVRPGGLPAVKAPPLSEGYRYSMYSPGDEADWAAIETSVAEFDQEEKALEYFGREFLPHAGMLPGRMVFVRDAQGRAVADAAAWWDVDEALGRVCKLHWVATRPEAQGKGLGRAVTCKALSLYPGLGDAGDVWLTTQTFSHVAIGLYLSLGFRAHRTCRIAGHDNGYAGAVSVLQSVMPPRAFAQLTETAIG